MKAAIVYEREGVLYFRTSSETKMGVWIEVGVPTACPKSAAHAEIGQKALDVLNASRNGVEHPTSWGEIGKPLLKTARVKSWKEFSRGAKSVTLELTDQVILMPSRNLGFKEGLEDLEDRKIVLSGDSEPVALGQAVLEALARCEVD